MTCLSPYPSLHLSPSSLPISPFPPTSTTSTPRPCLSPKPLLKLNSALAKDPSSTPISSPTNSIRTQKPSEPLASSPSSLESLKSLRTQAILSSSRPLAHFPILSSSSPSSHHRWSSVSSAISPKDAISLDPSSGLSARPLSHLSPLSPSPHLPSCLISSPHRRTHSSSLFASPKTVSWTSDLAVISPAVSRSRFSWASAYLPTSSSPDINHSPPFSRPSLPSSSSPLSSQQIQGIERLGVKYVDRAALGLGRNLVHSPSSASRPRSGSSMATFQLHSRTSSSRRNSISSPFRRRRSIKLSSSSSSSPTPLTPTGPISSLALSSAAAPLSSSSNFSKALAINPIELIQLLEDHIRPSQANGEMLIIDLRTLHSYLGPDGRLKRSINVNLPSLLIKRFRKSQHHHSTFQLSSFITTEAGKRFYSALEQRHSPNFSLGNKVKVVVVDDEGCNGERSKALVELFSQVFERRAGSCDGLFYLCEPVHNILVRRADADHHPRVAKWVVVGETCTTQEHDDEGLPEHCINHNNTEPSLDLHLRLQPRHLPQEQQQEQREEGHSAQQQPQPAQEQQGLRRLKPSHGHDSLASLPSIETERLSPSTNQIPILTSTSSCDSYNTTQSCAASPSPFRQIIAGKKSKPPKLRKIETSESFLLSSSSSANTTSPSSSVSHVTMAPPASPYPLLGGNGYLSNDKVHSHQADSLSGILGHGRRRPGGPGFANSGGSTYGRFRFPQPAATTTTTTSTTGIASGSTTIYPPSFKKTDEEMRCSPTSNLVDNTTRHARRTGSQDDNFTLTSSSTDQNHFGVSTILPGFLFLGSEPCTRQHFEKLRSLGVKRVLNVATECCTTTLSEEFLVPQGSSSCPTKSVRQEEEAHEETSKETGFIDKYIRLPFRDYVEEIGVQAKMEQANSILDDASLHSAPIYVHCKAGKSRSVTIVLGYLIHRFKWTLKDSYQHVSERRRGICPNIGFLAELMSFEEKVLGARSQVMSRSMSYQYPSTAGSAHLSALSLGGGGGPPGCGNNGGSTGGGRVRSVGNVGRLES